MQFVYKCPSSNPELDFTEFFFNRLYYKSAEELLKIYNDEVAIGPTNEIFQFILFLVLDRLFRKKIEESPIERVGKNSIKIKGKAKFLNGKLYYQQLQVI